MRLPFWPRRAPDERRHAIATLQSLGTTSIAGLAAALSWSVPRTERVLQELVRHGPPGLVYDSRAGTIRWGTPASPTAKPAPTPSPPVRTPNWAVSAARTSSRSNSAPTATAAVPSPAAPDSRSRPSLPTPSRSPAPAASDYSVRECSKCHIPLVPTDTAEEFACPMCGRRITSAGARISSASSGPSSVTGPDPRIQQLIAAWATGQPAPCPHCHQPLRHTADGEFRCGSCGARISYGPTPTASSAPAPPAAGTVL